MSRHESDCAGSSNRAAGSGICKEEFCGVSFKSFSDGVNVRMELQLLNGFENPEEMGWVGCPPTAGFQQPLDPNPNTEEEIFPHGYKLRLLVLNLRSLTAVKEKRAISSVGSEHLPYKQGVTGSSPVSPTKASSLLEVFFCLRIPLDSVVL